MVSSRNPPAVRLLSFLIVITDRKYRTDSSIISMSGLKTVTQKLQENKIFQREQTLEPPGRAFAFYTTKG